MTTTLEWFGCATFRLTIDGTVIFLDAYIDRAPGADGPPGATARSVNRADWVVVGHSHFDHLWGADTIAANTGATVIGSYETARILRQAGVADSQLLEVAGGERIPLSDTVTVRVVPAQHSCWWAPYDDEHPTADCVGFDELDYFTQAELGASNIASALDGLTPPTKAHVEAIPNSMGGDGGAFAYLFETPEGSLFFSDTPGHWRGIMTDLSADVAVLGVSGRPNVDGDAFQGSLADFALEQCALLEVRRMIPCHHDNYLPGFTTPFGIEELRSALERDVEVVQLDYETPLDVFSDLKAR